MSVLYVASLDTETHESLLEAAPFIEAIQRAGIEDRFLDEIPCNLGYINGAQAESIAEGLS